MRVDRVRKRTPLSPYKPVQRRTKRGIENLAVSYRRSNRISAVCFECRSAGNRFVQLCHQLYLVSLDGTFQ